MNTQELRNKIDNILGNSMRVLLPSYWWKKLFHQVADTIDTINGVEIVESEAKLKKLDVQQGSLASVAMRKETKISECYFLTEEDDSLPEAEVFAKLTPVKAIEVSFPLPDLSSADTSVQLVSEDKKNLGFLMLGKGLCAAIFYTDMAAGTQKYWILTSQLTVDAVNNFLKEKKFYVLDDREDIGEENMALLDSVFTIVDSNTDVYVKGMSWERLAKEDEVGESTGSGGLPIYIALGNALLTAEQKNSNKETLANIHNGTPYAIFIYDEDGQSVSFNSPIAMYYEGMKDSMNGLYFFTHDWDDGTTNLLGFYLNSDGIVTKDNDKLPDTVMSDTSTNSVQNKVIKAYVDNAVANVTIDTSSLATKEEVMENERVTATALYDLDTRVKDILTRLDTAGL